MRLDPVGHRDMVGFRDPVGHGDGRSVVQLVVHCGQLFFEMVAQMVARPELFSWDGRFNGRRKCDNYLINRTILAVGEGIDFSRRSIF